MLLAPIALMAATGAEQTVFRCAVRGGAVVVVREGATLTYRPVRRGRVELRLSGGHLYRTGYSGGGELQAVFRNGPWTYVVYERTIRTSFSGRSEPRFEAGVDVLRSDRTVSRRRCLDAGSQFEGELPDVLPQDDFVEH
jgi:hypothetical protein